MASVSSQSAALVVGGGLLGLEAAWGIAKKGLKVYLVHRSGWPLNRQLDGASGELLRRMMEKKNVHFLLGDEVAEFQGEEEVTGARLKSGAEIQCELAVIATGITPNKEVAIAAGLKGKRGIDVDEFMRTSEPNISAVGECTEFRGATFGLVEPVWQQCQTLAERLCYGNLTPFSNRPIATKLKVSGVNLFSAGDYLTTDQHRELKIVDPEHSIYRKILLKGNRIAGVVLLGDTRDGSHYFSLMEEGRDVSHLAATLVLGQSFYSDSSIEKKCA